jgi:hypothetical protein
MGQAWVNWAGVLQLDWRLSEVKCKTRRKMQEKESSGACRLRP